MTMQIYSAVQCAAWAKEILQISLKVAYKRTLLSAVAINCKSKSVSPSNSSIRLYTHFYKTSCMSCVDRELSRRKVFPCPICETLVKRVTLSTRSLDDIQCEKDTSWRRRVTKVYNKTQKDFKTLLEYNNYLEEVEDIIWEQNSPPNRWNQ